VPLVPKRLIDENFLANVPTKKEIIFARKSASKNFELLFATVAEIRLKKLRIFIM
jgi:hypothetical protein